MESKITDSIYVGIGYRHITKPDDYGVIESKEKAVGNYGYYEIDELADMVGNKGYSVVPSYLFNENKAQMNKPSMKQEDFVSCQMFMIDLRE